MKHRQLLLAFGLLLALSTAHADDVLVAVAANFEAPMQRIAQTFNKASGYKVLISVGSTGKLYAQIRNGAPFEILLSADTKTPTQLAAENLAVPTSQFTYAVGRLVLWSPKAGYIDPKGKIMRSGGFTHLAVANPDLAPYGAAAIQVLQKMNLLQRVKPKIVQGENISQTQEFIASGNADLGFIAFSQVMRGGKTTGGSLWVVPSDLYSPIRQDAILLNPGKGKLAAEALLKYLQSSAARAIIKSYGYGL